MDHPHPDWKAALTSYVEATESNLRYFRRDSREQQSPVQRLTVRRERRARGRLITPPDHAGRRPAR